MARPSGLKKTGGRTKGVPNKRTVVLAEVFEQANFDVPTKIMELLPSLSEEKQVDVLINLLRYLYPSRRAIDQTAALTLTAVSTTHENLNEEQMKAIIKEGLEILGCEIRPIKTRLLRP